MPRCASADARRRERAYVSGPRVAARAVDDRHALRPRVRRARDERQRRQRRVIGGATIEVLLVNALVMATPDAARFPAAIVAKPPRGNAAARPRRLPAGVISLVSVRGRSGCSDGAGALLTFAKAHRPWAIGYQDRHAHRRCRHHRASAMVRASPRTVPRIEAIGAVDELNSSVGVLLAETLPAVVQALLDRHPARSVRPGRRAVDSRATRRSRRRMSSGWRPRSSATTPICRR